MDPRALSELFPDWQERGAPLNQPVTEDAYVFLGEKSSMRVPNLFLPPFAHNEGNYIISLGALTKWLAEQAESLGVEIFPGFAAAEVLYNDDGSVKGVATGNVGVDKEGEPTPNLQLGMQLHARYTIFAEGARGHLGKQLIERYRLDEGRDPPSFGIGIKELWEIDPARHEPGFVMHTAGCQYSSRCATSDTPDGAPLLAFQGITRSSSTTPIDGASGSSVRYEDVVGADDSGVAVRTLAPVSTADDYSVMLCTSGTTEFDTGRRSRWKRSLEAAKRQKILAVDRCTRPSPRHASVGRWKCLIYSWCSLSRQLSESCSSPRRTRYLPAFLKVVNHVSNSRAGITSRRR